MKKLLVIALSVAMVFAFAAVSMAEVAFTGEIDTGYKSYSNDATSVDTNEPYIFGKIAANAKLGDAVTGTMVIKSNDDPSAKTVNTSTGRTLIDDFRLDEADFSYALGFGSLKFGYYGWNNNLKDIIDTVRGDVKSNFTSSAALKFGGVTAGIAYAFQGTNNTGDDVDAQYGVDFGYAADKFGVDVIYTAGNPVGTDTYSTTGVQAYYVISGFKPYVQFETSSDNKNAKGDDKGNTIIGFIFDNANIPVYGRFEYDLATTYGATAADDGQNEMGVRVGYKLANGTKIEAQDYMNVNGTKDSQMYLKLIMPF